MDEQDSSDDFLSVILLLSTGFERQTVKYFNVIANVKMLHVCGSCNTQVFRRLAVGEGTTLMIDRSMG